jgi:hypothetical protein
LLEGETHLGVDHIADVGTEEIHQLFLNEWQLSEEAVLVAREKGVSETTEAEGTRQAFELSISEDVG